MSRIKTIAKSGVILAIPLVLWMTLSSCREYKGGIGNFVVDDHLLKAIELENARFELKPSAYSQPLHPSADYWLKKGDRVALKWDSFEFHWERTGVMCSFENNTSTADCSICDYCQDPVVQNGSPCFGIALGTEVSSFDLVAIHDGFVLVPEPKMALIVPSRQMVNGCRPDSPDPISFEPETSATYQMIIPKTDLSLAYSPFDVVREAKIHVIEDDMSQTVAYQLMRQTIAGTNYWTWAITGDNLWSENFSPNLRVTEIRILKGVCADGSAEGKQCAIPGESASVKPSRILFLQDFQGAVPGDGGCYSDPNASPGRGAFINLDSCRIDEAGQTLQKFITPTYEFLPERPTNKLTWLVEFNTSEGADADLTTPGNDPMPRYAALIIEFTIQA
jgi:hypothetical protein